MSSPPFEPAQALALVGRALTPCASPALVIGRELARRTGLPWVADFRDPMAQPGFPADPRKWECFNAIERQTIAEADCCVFTTPGAAAEYQSRYPARAEHLHVIENGYDEESFASLTEEPAPLNPGATNGPLTVGSKNTMWPRPSTRRSAARISRTASR